MLFGSGILLLVAIAVWIWAAVDAFVTDPQKIHFLPKAAWIVIILLLMDIGAVLWLLFGRSRGAVRAGVPRESGETGWTLGGAGAPARGRGPIAPDDDPDFLLGLHNRLRKEKPDEPGDEPRA